LDKGWESYVGVVQAEPLLGTARRVGTIQNPYLFVTTTVQVLQDVSQGSEKGVYPYADILEVHHKDIEMVDHPFREPARLSVEAEDR